MTLASDLRATLPNAGSLNALNSAQGLIAMRPLSTKAGSPYKFFFDFEFAVSADMNAMQSIYSANPLVWWAHTVPSETPEPLCGPVLPNDPAMDSLWHLNQPNDIDINAPEAWEWTMGTDVVVAVCGGGIAIDTSMNGYYLVRPDLARNIWTNPNEIPSNSADDDSNGFVDDVHGWNVFHDNGDIEARVNSGRYNDSFQDIGHGTFCAAWAASQIDNTPLGPCCNVPPAEENWTSRGWIGVAPKSKIMGTTFSVGQHRRFPGDSARFGAWGIVYAYENGALVWSYSYASAISYLRPFVDSAYSRGTLVTNAFGNAFHPGFDFPPNGISCQMLTQEGTFYPNHPLNSSLEILTPSVFGSSNAAPSVAGVLALMKSANPNLQAHQLRHILLHATSTTPVPGAPAGVGRTDAMKAIRNATAAPTFDKIEGQDGEHPLLRWIPNSIISVFLHNPVIDQYVIQRKRHYLNEDCFQDIASVAGTATEYLDATEILGRLVGEHAPPTEYRVRARLNYGASTLLSIPSNVLTAWTHSDAGGSGDGVGKISSHEIPKQTKLLDNYPNPFNPKTVIRFDIAEAGFVKLILFDVLGREVRAIVNERLESGTHNRLLDATQLPSGVYFYRLEAGAFMDTKKLVISK